MSDNGFARAQWAYENRMPPEYEPCCALAEDDEEHDVEACLADQAEAAAEARAEAQRDRERDWDD